MSEHLWRIADQIEYPEAAFLARKFRGRGQWSLPHEPLRHGLYGFFVQRLLDLGLLATDNGRYTGNLNITGLGEKLIEFAWDDDMEESSR